jgi:(p)ppGpp synthase/HD superfamily hydrolase
VSETEHPIVSLAIELANEYHAGQIDKSGRPYLGHLERTATKVRFSGGTWVQEAAAWLHDSLEDTEATAAALLKAGIPMGVMKIVKAMTHIKGVSNHDYWCGIREEPSAVLVKLCDIYDNLDPARMCYVDHEKQKRLRTKYAHAIMTILGDED